MDESYFPYPSFEEEYVEIPPLVENRVLITRPLFLEWRNSGKTESYHKTLRNFTIFMALLLVGALALFYSQGMPPFMMAAESSLVVIIYLWLVLFHPRSRNKSQYKAMCKNADGTPERIARFYKDCFSVTNDFGEAREFSYKKILEIKETEHLYVIIIDESDIDVILDKNGFTVGDIEQVKKLL